MLIKNNYVLKLIYKLFFIKYKEVYVITYMFNCLNKRKLNLLNLLKCNYFM